MERTSPKHESASLAPLLKRLEAAWRRTDQIFAMVRPGSFGERPIGRRHPLVFYVGHLPAFTWNLYCDRVLGATSPRPDLDRLFDFGIDPEEDQAPDDATAWPEMKEILAYRDRVRATVRASLSTLERLRTSHPLAENGRILHVVLEHELMHHETLLYMLQELGFEHKQRPNWWTPPVLGDASVLARRVRVAPGRVQLGASFDELEFGWDNEFPARSVDVAGFAIDSHPTTIDDYRAFVDVGGYMDPTWWTSKGWSSLQRRGLEAPKDWVEHGGTWFVRTMFEYVPLEDVGGWPVVVSWAEAAAFARWSGARLPTEPELLRAGLPEIDPKTAGANVDLRRCSPLPVGSVPQNASPLGVHGVVGDGWEWTSTAFDAHEGFEGYVPGYENYSSDFFDGEHYVLVGGSWATDHGLVRPTLRNWFRHDYPYPFTKFRLAHSG